LVKTLIKQQQLKTTQPTTHQLREKRKHSSVQSEAATASSLPPPASP
jgi:hypothetical protein